MAAPNSTGFGSTLWWRVLPASVPPGAGGRPTLWVEMGGDLDENASFVELAGQLSGRVVFDLAQVRRINSCGAREWVTFQRDLVPPSVTLELCACSPSVVAQLNTIANFRGRARVSSFLAPYLCERCNHEEQLLVPVAPDPRRTVLPAPRCPRCQAQMTFDDLPDRYLGFLLELEQR